jgi:UV DNA damage endonuclease
MKVGAACKWVDTNGVSEPSANFRISTVGRLSKLETVERHNWMLELVQHNMSALRKQLELVTSLPPQLRMWRLGSDVLPVATHAVTQAFYADKDVEALITKRLRWCGNFAQTHNIRLSFHPGQFVVLGSQSETVRSNSLRELEYHCDVFTRMGYSGWHPNGLAVNIHVGLKTPDIKAMRKLLVSRDSDIRNMVTLENDEFSWGAESIVETFGDTVPLVLDVHHYWIHTGRRLQPTDTLVKKIRDTWRGQQPKLHLAMSHPHLCGEADPEKTLKLQTLLDAGQTRAGLRAHSETAWHNYSIDYAAQFGFDIMWEGKNKNLGAQQIAERLKLV